MRGSGSIHKAVTVRLIDAGVIEIVGRIEQRVQDGFTRGRWGDGPDEGCDRRRMWCGHRSAVEICEEKIGWRRTEGDRDRRRGLKRKSVAVTEKYGRQNAARRRERAEADREDSFVRDVVENDHTNRTGGLGVFHLVHELD